MPYIGNQPLTAAFVTDQFNGNGSTTVFTMSVAPASTSSMLVVVSGIIQDPGTYAINGLTLMFSQAPPIGTGNVSVRYLGIPASGVVNTAYRTVTEMTATPSQTTFNVPSYTAGFINVYRNGVRLAPSDFTATSGVTVVLVNAATSGDRIVTESFYVSSVLNAIPNIPRSVSASNMPAGSVLQVVQSTSATQVSSSSTNYVSAGLAATITPTSVTSKILILTSAPVANTNQGQSQFTIYRNSTNIGGGAQSALQMSYTSSGYSFVPLNMEYLDSPTTTSATTYTVYFNSLAGTAYVNSNQCLSTITLMEIAA